MAKKIHEQGSVWERDEIQFPRLLAEIAATQELGMDALCESMDLTQADIDELFDRASTTWQRIATLGIDQRESSEIL